MSLYTSLYQSIQVYTSLCQSIWTYTGKARSGIHETSSCRAVYEKTQCRQLEPILIFLRMLFIFILDSLFCKRRHLVAYIYNAFQNANRIYRLSAQTKRMT